MDIQLIESAQRLTIESIKSNILSMHGGVRTPYVQALLQACEVDTLDIAINVSRVGVEGYIHPILKPYVIKKDEMSSVCYVNVFKLSKEQNFNVLYTENFIPYDEFMEKYGEQFHRTYS